MGTCYTQITTRITVYNTHHHHDAPAARPCSPRPRKQDPSDELVDVEPHDLGQLDLGDMWLWSILQAC